MTFLRLISCLALLSFSLSASAARLVPDLQHLDAIPMHSLPALKVQKAVADALSKNKPLQFAVTAPLSLSLDDGTWQQLDDGSWSWRMRVFSSGAQTLNFHFSKFHMPAGGSLWLYDENGKVTGGPYTSANEMGVGGLWTAVVFGETAVIEARVPAALKDQFQLTLADAHHGYRDFGRAAASSCTGFGCAAQCEVDVACSADSNIANEARALARITIGGDVLCSGQLVNNVLQDNTPFFLTANHCGITSSNANSVVFYWNYQTSVCDCNAAAPSSSQNQTGSIWVAGDETSDFTLIKAAQAPDPSYNLYLAGWNAGTSAPQSGSVVHHPKGDVTKLSLYTTAATSANNVGLCDGTLGSNGSCSGTVRSVNVWSVSYSQGVTEPGSSGSALYDQNHLIVGQLSGGQSACNGNVGNGLPDIYGRTNAAWEANAASNGQLKANLDPNNTGQLTLAGKNLNVASSSVTASRSTSSCGDTAFSSTTSSSSGSGSSGGGGGALAPFTLLGLAGFALMRRRPTSGRASSV